MEMSFLFEVNLLLLWDKRILIPKDMIACVPSLLSMLTSGSHIELSDCILILISTYSLVLPSVIPSTAFCNPCFFSLYPDCCFLYSLISCRAPRAFSTQAFTSTHSLHWSLTFPPVPQPWVQTLPAPLPLQRTSPDPQGRFFRRIQWHYSANFSLNTGNLTSPANWNTEFKTSLGAVAQVMQVSKRQSIHWLVYSKPFIL